MQNCLTALEDLRLLHLFSKRGLFELQSKIVVVVGEREVMTQKGHLLLRESQTRSVVRGA